MEDVAFTNNFYVTIICFKYDRLLNVTKSLNSD